MARRFFQLFFLFFSHSVTVQSVIYELKGQQVQFHPDTTGQPEQILWRHNKESIVEFNGFEERVFGSYKGRVTLNWHSAQLQISDLHLEDSGKYEYEIVIGGKFFHQSYELEVIEKVAKPTIICLMNSDSSSTVSAVLLCSVELSQPQSSVNFAWSSKGNDRYGPQLTIFLGGERDEEEYTCRVSNPRSNETATFRAKDCPKALTKKSGLSAEMIALIVLFSILIVIICLGLLILLWRRRHEDAGLSAGMMIAVIVLIPILIICVDLLILDFSAEMIFGIVFFLILIVHTGLLILLWRLIRKRRMIGRVLRGLMIAKWHSETPPTQTDPEREERMKVSYK